MRDHKISADGLEAVAEVIKSVGFHAMAAEFIERPEYRDRIVACMTKNIARDGKLELSRKFNALAQNVLHGTQVWA